MRLGRDRWFRLIFEETTTHVALLSRVKTVAWWDGYTLLLEHATSRRVRSECEWPDPDRSVAAETVIVDAKAVRRAIELHDIVCTAFFIADDLACASTDKEAAVSP